jgi:hypothetical protein
VIGKLEYREKLKWKNNNQGVLGAIGHSQRLRLEAQAVEKW